jgi:pimeloyl-ACP methyl ester carboxylesterase
MAQRVSQAIQIAEETVAVVAVVFLVGLVLYAVVSFVLMRPHAADRPGTATVRELLRETILAGLMQPLLPLFYFVGRRMDRFLVVGARAGLERSGARAPVVFVHGYMQNRVGFVALARALARRGHGPLYGFNYPWFSSLDANAARLEAFVSRVCEETGAAKVDLVCHSMGGLVAIEMMRDEKKHDALKVRRAVTIASPHGGVVWQGPLIGWGADNLRRGSKLLAEHAAAKLAIPILSIYSTHDNVVHPKETSSLAVRGGRDLEVDGPGHFAILFSPAVARAVIDFLEEEDAPQVRVVEATMGGGAKTVVEEDEVGDEERETETEEVGRGGA